VIVVDRSAVVDALIGASEIDQLIETLSGEDVHAPQLLDYEIVAAVRGLVLGGHLSVGRGEDVLTDFADLPVERWPADPALRVRAFQLRDNLSAYDGAYIALAEALDCPLVTRDRRQARTTGHAAQVVVL